MKRLLLMHCITIPSLFAIVFISDYICPFRMLTETYCPGCGITSAYLHVFKLDWVAAYNHHPLYLILPLYVLWLIHLHTPLLSSLNKYVKLSISLGIGSIILLNYINRVFI